jgi:hypothetical protein
MKAITIALATALLATSGAAAAQSASDAQCLILSNAFAKSAKDAQQKSAAEAAQYFYLGRISDGMTAAQLKTLLETQAKTISEKTAADMMTNCVRAVGAKVSLVQSVAKPAEPAQQPKGR